MVSWLKDRAEYAKLIEKYDTFLFDCDGVLWNGDHVIQGVTEVMGYLRSKQKSVIFVTNNAAKSRQDYKSKFDKSGIQAEVDEIFGSAYASAVYLSTVVKLPRNKKVYVIGMAGLEAELASEGISYVGGTAPEDHTLESFSLSDFRNDPDIGAVLCGLDMHINYTKLAKAFQYLRLNEGCLFLATNTDSTFPVNGGLLPGSGSLCASLGYALKKDPVSIGKPGPTMLDCIKAKHDFDPKRTIMIGDRLDTDIQFGKNGGVSTLLVLTGVTSIEQVTPGHADFVKEIVPDYVLRGLSDLQVLLEA